ncbi:hypothetical protein BHU72_06630 [Desulfuribacillus stibiiarsenatis]|uniref:DNA mismatch repair proteins mutS family domain-containing protein n=1 Tax=Desulfuribacillus stibiiarsenatis TaxID=1390249 RepID=A0A1E5L429_9FIRM|nr:MutS family DNA mismatch repair protein [Desulfuribacillus stibiiarsenatis]OEH84865.1 hypothetical protein BHU72_06630 [Desulfuribacillus stibiiarsenatis]
MSSIHDYRKAIHTYRDQEVIYKKQLDTVSHIRLGIFLVGAAIVGYFSWMNENVIALLLLGIFTMAFLWAVIRHNLAKKQLNRIRCKITINNQYIDRTNGNWITFKDAGNDFVQPSHPYTSDLDIFGQKSLFQWMNVASTFVGRTILRNYLLNSEKDAQAITERHSAVQELAESFEFAQELQCEGMLGENINDNPEPLLSYIENPKTMFPNENWRFLFYALPVATIVSIVLTVLRVPYFEYIALAMLVVQVALTAIGFARVSEVLSTIYDCKSSIEAYSNIIHLIEKEKFQSAHLNKIQSNVRSGKQTASSQIIQLSKLVDRIDMRHSAFLYFILNTLFLWDYHCVFALENWKRENRHQIRKWLETIGAIEALSSLAVIKRIQPNWSYPKIYESNDATNGNNRQATKDIRIIAGEMGHPLIVEENRVCNDFSIQNHLGIVTGSNMSGKTTLLRTIGINLVLAYAGAPVCAKKFECSMMDIFTSMRITDDLNSGISSFYAELLRIKTIIEYVNEEKPMLFLIDEIFRGTNSQDRIIGAKNVLVNLSKDWVIGLISTHDFELCDLEHDKKVKIENYHFTEHYINNEIKFDYKLRKGRCRTTNAKYLMKMVGIQFLDERQL